MSNIKIQGRGDNALKLVNGIKMPLVGLGTWQATDEKEVENAVEEALKAGYRHFDTAYNYTNENIIGRVLKSWLDAGKLKREDLFITTKLPMIGMQPEKVSYFLQKQLAALQLNYVDLYLIHSTVGMKYINDTELFPRDSDGKLAIDMTTNLEAIWKAMEVEVNAGKIKSIGLSNFNEKQVERIVKVAKVPVANLQVECHVYFQQKSLREVCAKHNISVCAYAPFASPGRAAIYASRGLKFTCDNPLEEPLVKELAKKHCVNEAQILLRFFVQQNVIVIPKSTNAQRLRQNFEIFDFELSTVEMRRLEALDRGAEGRTFKLDSFPGAEKHPECPY